MIFPLSKLRRHVIPTVIHFFQHRYRVWNPAHAVFYFTHAALGENETSFVYLASIISDFLHFPVPSWQTFGSAESFQNHTPQYISIVKNLLCYPIGEVSNSAARSNVGSTPSAFCRIILLKKYVIVNFFV